MWGGIGRLLALSAMFLIGAVVAAEPDKTASARGTEGRLLEAWELWQSGEPDRAASEFRSLLAQRPQYKLGWLLYGDLLNAMSGHNAKLPLSASDPRVKDLNAEMERRLIKRDLTSDAVPGNLIHVSGETSKAIVVDLSQGRLFLLQRDDNGWHRVRDHFAGIGQLGVGKRARGDLRTPVGVYHINGFLSDADLPDKYGAGALTLDYPNDWDHADNRSGHGIWIHGVPRDTYVRAPQSSQGCVTLANEDFESLRKAVGAGTPVVLADNVQWLFAEEAEALKQEWLDRLDQWRLAWLSGDSTRVGGFYGKAPRPASYRELDVDGVNVYEYPGEKDLVLAQFKVSRSLNGRASESNVEQFWRRTAAGDWRIVLEKGVTGSVQTVSLPAKPAKKARTKNQAKKKKVPQKLAQR
jgi:lipoprotein-anchoring transpeptidase ErfK/SrfK